MTSDSLRCLVVFAFASGRKRAQNYFVRGEAPSIFFDRNLRTSPFARFLNKDVSGVCVLSHTENHRRLLYAVKVLTNCKSGVRKLVVNAAYAEITGKGLKVQFLE